MLGRWPWKWNSWSIILPSTAKIFESGIADKTVDWIRIMPNEGKLPDGGLIIRKLVQLKRIEHPNDWTVRFQAWAHLSPCFVTQPIQKRLEPTSELVSPIRLSSWPLSRRP